MKRATIFTIAALTLLAVLGGLVRQRPHAMDQPNPGDVVFRNLTDCGLMFTANAGQFHDAVLFRADAGGATVWFTQNSLFFHFTRLLDTTTDEDPLVAYGYRLSDKPDSLAGHIVRLAILDVQSEVEIVGQAALGSYSSYFLGNDSDNWRLRVPNYREVSYLQVYPGIDLKFKGACAHLEYDFVVSPFADPSQIRLQYHGIDSLSINDSGDLVVSTAFGRMIETRPVTYQLDSETQISVAGDYLLYGDNTFGFDLGPGYDSSLPLVIDPVLSFSGFVGGGGNDYGRGVAIDSAGCTYITGYTNSLDFPLADALDSTYNDTTVSCHDVFVLKLSATGDSLIYSTYIGGAEGDDRGVGISVYDDGSAYLTGVTASGDFPVVEAVQSSNS
ncbi:MAG: SBBP repeat-containing protein, partial [candidate division Zixibacteria bacterium]|nr:SBBP repeat-containing protein [candidate division Zixibacteria bacterium]